MQNKMGIVMPTSAKKLGYKSRKNADFLIAAVQSYVDFVNDPKALRKAETWAKKLVELENIPKNVKLYADLKQKMDRK
jgi:hypothetical protein